MYYQLINAIRNCEGATKVSEIFRRNAQNDEFFALLGGNVYGKPFDAAR